MTAVDAEGRLFGRINVVDALCAVFLLGLIPAAYVSWLLFRPAAPVIRSVEPSAVTVAEQRIAAGLPIRLKVKVRGDHLAPLLRATVDGVAAIGFTFETPQSADVIIGENVPFGTHDLVLYDGIQEVARARRAITILPPATPAVHAIGSLVQLDAARAAALHAGQRFEIDGHPAAEIVALGEPRADQPLLADRSGHIEPVVEGQLQRDAIVAVHCEHDADESRCRIGTTAIDDAADAVVDVPGAAPRLRMRVLGIVPEAGPRAATLRVGVAGHPELAGAMRAGDRDARWPSIDTRAAVVSTATASAGGFELVLRLGVDRGASAWRYHGQALSPGAAFSFVTSRYAVEAQVVDVVIDEH